MKKLFLFTALLIAALFSANAFAYQVYINDPCKTGINEKYWDGSHIAKIGVLDMTTDGGGIWPGWFYDAQGTVVEGAIDRVEGLITVPSKAFRVAEEGEMFLSMEYYVLTRETSNMRNFGARIRLITSNNWDTLFAIRPQGGIFPSYRSGYNGTAVVSLGDKYNGQAVVLELFFYNDTIANDPFIMLFHDVFCASYGIESHVENKLVSRSSAYGDTYEAGLNCTNQSLTPITSIEYAYSINGKAEKKQTVTFAGSLKRSETASFSLNLDITEANKDASNRIRIWPATINDQAYVAEDTIDFTLAVIDESRLDQDYIPMLECFTSATCIPYCQNLNVYLNPTLAELKSAGKINVVKYQMNIPTPGDRYYISGNATRANLYNVIGTPTLIFDGIESPIADWGCVTSRELMNELKKRVEAVSKNKSFFTIKVNKAKVTSEDVVELDFDITSHLLGDKRMLVYVMVIEGTTHGNSVSSEETDFHYVNMAFATPASGKASYFTQDEVFNFTYTVDMKKTRMEEPEDLQVVIFVQDPSDNYIYQSASFVMGDGVAVEDEDMAQVSLRPNPASEMVYVEGLEKARVEIFDLAGRKVYERTDANDVLEVSLASFAKGTYVVRIAQNGAVASRKLVVK